VRELGISLRALAKRTPYRTGAYGLAGPGREIWDIESLSRRLLEVSPERGAAGNSLRRTRRAGRNVRAGLHHPGPLRLAGPGADQRHRGRIRGLGKNKGGAAQVVKIDGKEQIQLWGARYKKK
jgi:hypothetical protein